MRNNKPFMNMECMNSGLPAGLQKGGRNPRNARKGMTLIEIIVAVAILAIIAAPMLSLFATSTKNTVLSEYITASSYLSQAEMERLIKLDYLSLLAESRNFCDPATNELILKYAPDGSYPQIGYTIRMIPSGVHDDLLTAGTKSQYIQFLIYNKDGLSNTTMSLFYPDGRSEIIESIGTTLKLSAVTTSGYTHQITTGSPARNCFFTADPAKRMILISNLYSVTTSFTGVTCDLSSLTTATRPLAVIYAKDQEIVNKYVLKPLPTYGNSQIYAGGDSYDKMLVTVYIDAYFVKNGTKRLISSLHDTISPTVIIPAT